MIAVRPEAIYGPEAWQECLNTDRLQELLERKRILAVTVTDVTDRAVLVRVGRDQRGRDIEGVMPLTEFDDRVIPNRSFRRRVSGRGRGSLTDSPCGIWGA